MRFVAGGQTGETGLRAKLNRVQELFHADVQRDFYFVISEHIDAINQMGYDHLFCCHISFLINAGPFQKIVKLAGKGAVAILAADQLRFRSLKRG